MFVQLLAIAVAVAPPQTQIILLPPAPPADTALTPAARTELERLRTELPKPSKPAELLNATEVAGHMDYPKEALDKDEQGTVKVWLLIGADGRAQRCIVAESSGSQTLDAQTCDLYVANARYTPAKDRRGREVASLVSQVMAWRMEDGPATTASVVRNTLVVAPDGQVRSCKAELQIQKAWIEGPAELCSRFVGEPNPLVLIARARSKLHDALVVIDQATLTDSSLAMPALGRGAGEVLILLRSGTLHYAPDGTWISCTPGETVGIPEYPDFCATEGESESYPGGDPKPANVRVKTAIYLKGEPN